MINGHFKTTQRIKVKEEAKVKKHKSVHKVQNLLRNTAKFKITQEQAFKNNVLEITIEPERVGGVLASDMKAYVARTFLMAKKKYLNSQLFNYMLYAI